MFSLLELTLKYKQFSPNSTYKCHFRSLKKSKVATDTNVSDACIGSSLTVLILQCQRFLFPARSDCFPAVGYQTLAFIQALENQKMVKKTDSSDKTGKKKKKTGDGKIQNSLNYLLLHLPWLPVWPAQWEMHQENVIAGDYSEYQKSTDVCSHCSQVQHFPLTHKTQHPTAIY